MPTGVYVRANAVTARLRAGLAADHVDDFSRWLQQRHYTDKTIIERMRLLACWTHWAWEAGFAPDSFTVQSHETIEREFEGSWFYAMR